MEHRIRKPRKFTPSLDMKVFKERADPAAFWEAWVGAVLARCGLHTHHYPFTIAESHSEIAEYGNTWDLDVRGEGEQIQVEVKSQNKEFTCPSDYPKDPVILCSDANWQKKWGDTNISQRDFLLVSRVTGCLVWVPVGTVVLRGQKGRDNQRNIDFYVTQVQKASLRTLSAFVSYFK